MKSMIEPMKPTNECEMPAMTTNPTPASVLRQAEAITGEAGEFLMVKELVAALKVLVEIANAAEVKA